MDFGFEYRSKKQIEDDIRAWHTHSMEFMVKTLTTKELDDLESIIQKEKSERIQKIEEDDIEYSIRTSHDQLQYRYTEVNNE